MPDQTTSTRPIHDETVPWAAVIVSGNVISLADWQLFSYHDPNDQPGIVCYRAIGPCPGCGAQQDSGEVAAATSPIESQERADLPVAPPVDIRFQCECQISHGHDGASGCGRRWVIPIPRMTP
jgi:hypothetical protein